MIAGRPSAPWLAPVTGLLLAVVMVAVALRYGPPAPKASSAPAAEFSAERAYGHLTELTGDGAPHPAGTPANAAVRARLLAELRRLGYAPEVEEALVCSGRGVCARVHNVIARRPGSVAASVLLSAHYDSVGAGPGASDDGVGVAALLEIARVLASEPPARSSVVLLVSDGEELGLLGAEAFAEENPLARDVRVVVNLEARGTSGPSSMFETNRDNAWIIGMLAREVARPVTSSLFYAVYQALPNDTDVSVFKRRGLQALNFAFIGRPAQYHTPLDDLAHADRGSLQHHGDNALSMVRALAAADLENPPRGDAVWFDVLAFGIVRWPEGATIGLALFACALFVAAVFAAVRSKRIALGALAWGSCAMPAIASASMILGIASTALLHAVGAIPAPWIAHPEPALIALAAGAIGLCFGISTAIARKTSPWAIWFGTWIAWTMIAVALAIAAPSVSFLFLVPAIAAGLSGCGALMIGTRTREPLAVAALPPIVVTALLWLPILNQLYDALGLQVGVVFAFTAGVALTAVAPVAATMVSGRRAKLALGVGVVAIIAEIVAVAMPPFSPEAPEHASLVYDGGRSRPRWMLDSGSGFGAKSSVSGESAARAMGLIGGPAGSESLREALGPSARFEPMFAWMPGRTLTADAPDLALEAPAMEIETRSASGTDRRVRLRLRSARGASWIEVHVPPTSRIAEMDLVGAIPLGSGGLRAEPGGFRGLRVACAAEVGIELDVTVRGEDDAEVVVMDASQGLPPEGAALLRARGAATVPSGLGDRTLAARVIHL